MLVEITRNGERAEAEALAFLTNHLWEAREELGIQSRWMAAQVSFSMVIELASAVPHSGWIASIEEIVRLYSGPSPLRTAAQELVKEFDVRRVD